jgi:hypothetical protein
MTDCWKDVEERVQNPSDPADTELLRKAPMVNLPAERRTFDSSSVRSRIY